MEALQSIGTFFGSSGGKGLTSLAELGATGAGLFGNISAERQKAQEMDYLKKQQNAIGDPTKLAAEVAAATQPLNRALVQDVGNQVSGTLAEQGLSQAPGIQASTLATSLAPFEQQNQQTALQLVMKRLGLPIEYANALLANNPKGTNLAPLLALLQKGNTGAATGAVGMQPAVMPAANASWNASLPGQSSAPPPDSSSWMPEWLTSDSSAAPSFGG
jgi:hypothetical protein